MSLIPFVIFSLVWKEKKIRVFERVEEEFDRVRDRWFETLVVMGPL